MRTPLLLVALSIGMLGAVACQAPDRQWAANLPPGSRDALVQWLMCEDCATVEARDAAAQVGINAYGPLEAVLVRTPDEWRQSMMARYGRLARRIGEDSARLVEHYLARFDATIQRRSILLLGTIGGQPAAAILRRARDAAVRRGYSDDVIRAIHITLADLELQPFSGQLSDSTADFLDTVVVYRGAGPPWDGNESVSLTGSPYPDDVMVWRTTDSLGFVAAGETGWYALTLSGMGPGAQAMRDSFHIRSFPAPPQSAPVNVPLDSLPRTILLSLAQTPALRDTARFYRFQSSIERTINATVDWPGRSTIALVWQDCSNQSFPGASRTISGTVVNDEGNPLGSAIVTVQGTSLAAATDSNGAFSISLVPPAWTGTIRAMSAGAQPMTMPAAEGRSGYWMVLHPQGSLPQSFSRQIFTSTSAKSATLVVPRGACRLLGVVKTDSTVATVIARLRVMQP